MPQHVLITGAAGFIGSHLVDRVLAKGFYVTGIDNLSRGLRFHLTKALESPRFRFFEADLNNTEITSSILEAAMNWAPIDTVWHMAANSDIEAGVADPMLDLKDTFLTTFNTLLMMRKFKIPKIAFASSSAAYGNHTSVIAENSAPMLPISNYGAMKLAGEASISAAAESFLERSWIFRFPNVIGPRATHGIIFDLMRKLANNPLDLEVLGDGTQQKPYLHVSELIDSMWFIFENAKESINIFNVGPDDEGASVKYIAEAVLRCAAPGKKIRYTGGRRGWVGDVPRFQYSIDKVAKLGWKPQLDSGGAVDRAIREIYDEVLSRCN